MEPRKLSDSYAVAPQITPEDVPSLAQNGFRSIMCNRPDGEEFGQPDFAQIEAAAEAAGLEIRWVPIVSGAVTPEALEAFRTALDDMPGPMLAYCRSGTRCAMLWAITQSGTLPDDEIIAATRAAGYDMAGVVQQMRQMRG